MPERLDVKSGEAVHFTLDVRPGDVTRACARQADAHLGVDLAPILPPSDPLFCNVHFSVVISHSAKKLARLIFALQRFGQSYCHAAWPRYSFRGLSASTSTQPTQRTLDDPEGTDAQISDLIICGLPLADLKTHRVFKLAFKCCALFRGRL